MAGPQRGHGPPDRSDRLDDAMTAHEDRATERATDLNPAS
jgi:hypothetical protein